VPAGESEVAVAEFVGELEISRMWSCSAARDRPHAVQFVPRFGHGLEHSRLRISWYFHFRNSFDHGR